MTNQITIKEIKEKLPNVHVVFSNGHIGKGYIVKRFGLLPQIYYTLRPGAVTKTEFSWTEIEESLIKGKPLSV